MMPASRVRPVILIPRSSSSYGPHRNMGSSQQRAPLAQKAQELDQRQAENGKVVTGNPREQLDTPTLQPIGANRPEQRVPLGGNVRFQKGIAELPHDQLRRARRAPQ